MPDVRLKVNGSAYGGWKDVRIVRGIEQLAGSFSLGVSERWFGQSDPRRIVPGDACELAIDGTTVITGYVDLVGPAYDPSSHTVNVSGRDATGDLVDCSAIKGSGQFKGRALAQIATDLCKPFGIGVTVADGVDVGKPFNSFALQEGETVFEALERMARIRAVLLTSDGLGGLLITRAGTERCPTMLKNGVNIKAAAAVLDHKDRFQTYMVKAQAPATDYWNAAAAAHVRGTANDPAVKRYRPQIIVGESQADGLSAKDRAVWQSKMRAARSLNVTVRVQDWSHADGLWMPNAVVHIADDWLQLDHDLLIKTVTLTKDDRDGTVTELALTDPQAYTLLPLKETKGDTFKWDVQPKKGAAK
jgi:prophage tail gpP-like protein